MTTDGGGVVLVIEQDPGVVALERLYLAREGYDVRVETDPDQAVEAVRLHRPDAIVVDLPDSEPDLYHRVAEACAGTAIVCVVPDGAEAPGRHSVRRPFSPRVLVAAVGQALREDSEAPSDPEDVLRAGGLTITPGDHTVLADGSPVALTSTEFDLLTYLMRHPGRVHSRERLLAAVWGSPGSAGTRTVDVHVAQMRAKLGVASPIRTVRGVGYGIDV